MTDAASARTDRAVAGRDRPEREVAVAIGQGAGIEDVAVDVLDPDRDVGPRHGVPGVVDDDSGDGADGGARGDSGSDAQAEDGQHRDEEEERSHGGSC